MSQSKPGQWISVSKSLEERTSSTAKRIKTIAQKNAPLIAASTPIRNSTMQSIYDGAELRTVVRDKSDDHERHPSRYSHMRVWRSGRQERA